MTSWTVTQIIAGLLAGLGIYLLFQGLLRLLRPNPEQFWRKVPCRIVVSEVLLSRKVYRADIRYTFAMDGQTYQGSRIAPIETWSSFRPTAARFVEKYPVGCDTAAYVCASDANRSVLEPQQQPVAALAESLMGLALCGLGYLGWLTAGR